MSKSPSPTPSISSESNAPQKKREQQNKKQVVKKNKKDKGKQSEAVEQYRWSPADDIQLCKSWLATSKDSITGTDRSYDSLWSDVLKHYVEATGKNRTQRSLELRWSDMQARTNEYVGCCASVKMRSGYNASNLVYIKFIYFHSMKITN
jgi:hypothetical protein